MNEGDFLAIAGKSGSGKTTLVKCIFGLEDLQAGEILLDGEPVSGPAFNLIPGHERMKLVSQEYYVLENHSVEENVFDKLGGFHEDEKQKRALKIMQLLELLPIKNIRTKDLSSGQKQRVAIARALAVIPKVLLLDEPFSHLDKLLSEKLFSFIAREVKKNKTIVILVTHRAEEALKYADRIVIMNEGKIVQSGPKWEVYYNPVNIRLAGLLGDFNLIKKEDLNKGSKIKFKTRLFARPDKMKLSGSRADLALHVLHSSFNGKCYEILGETRTGQTLIVYSSLDLQPGKSYQFSIDR